MRPTLTTGNVAFRWRFGAWRVTPQPSLGNLSPYWIVLGLEPRTPFSFTSDPVGRLPLPVTDYVREMTEVYDATLRFVRDFKAERAEQRIDQVARRSQTTKISIGDFVLVVKAVSGTEDAARIDLQEANASGL